MKFYYLASYVKNVPGSSCFAGQTGTKEAWFLLRHMRYWQPLTPQNFPCYPGMGNPFVAVR